MEPTAHIQDTTRHSPEDFLALCDPIQDLILKGDDTDKVRLLPSFYSQKYTSSWQYAPVGKSQSTYEKLLESIHKILRSAMVEELPVLDNERLSPELRDMLTTIETHTKFYSQIVASGELNPSQATNVEEVCNRLPILKKSILTQEGAAIPVRIGGQSVMVTNKDSFGLKLWVLRQITKGVLSDRIMPSIRELIGEAIGKTNAAEILKRQKEIFQTCGSQEVADYYASVCDRMYTRIMNLLSQPENIRALQVKRATTLLTDENSITLSSSTKLLALTGSPELPERLETPEECSNMLRSLTYLLRTRAALFEANPIEALDSIIHSEAPDILNFALRSSGRARLVKDYAERRGLEGVTLPEPLIGRLSR